MTDDTLKDSAPTHAVPDNVVQVNEVTDDALEDSAAYQFWVKQGALATIRRFVLLLGTRRFGAPSAVTEATIASLTDHSRLDRMIDRLLPAAESWDDLLSTP